MRYSLTEATHVLGKFDSGDTVTISLYDISTGAAVAFTSGSCSEIGATGVFGWAVSNIQTAPEEFTEYLWVMSNGTISSYGKLSLGGYLDHVDADISSRLAADGYTAPDNTTIVEIDAKIDTVRKLVSNRAKLEGNQLILYDDDGTTPIKTYDLFDADGNPSMTEVYDRVPV